MAPKIEIVARNMRLTDNLREYIEKKAGKLERHLQDIDEIRVEVSHVKSARSATDRQVAQMTVHGRGFILWTEERADDIHAAFDTALDKMDRQVERYKGKRNRGRGDGRSAAAVGEEQVSVDEEPGEPLRMLHELEVHQVELELQNEELCRTQGELHAARERYFDLYEMAPVGYVTVSEKGLILEANLTAATLLGVGRGTLAGQPSRFILKEDQDLHYRLWKQLFETGAPHAYELRMVRRVGATFWAHLETNAAQSAGGEPVYHFVLSDVTTRKRAEETIKSQLEELQRWQDVMLDREDRVQELKREVNELCRRTGETARYPSQDAGSADADTAEPTS